MDSLDERAHYCEMKSVASGGVYGCGYPHVEGHPRCPPPFPCPERTRILKSPKTVSGWTNVSMA